MKKLMLYHLVLENRDFEFVNFTLFCFFILLILFSITADVIAEVFLNAIVTEF